jgi:DNA-binding CsgD family transcriptional regulator
MDGVVETRLGVAAAREFGDRANGGLARVMDELVHGVLLASVRGDVLHANQAAREELASREVLAVHEGRLQTADARQARVLLDALAKAQDGRRSLIDLPATTRASLSIAVVPLRAEHERPVALFLSRASVCDTLMLCFFARTHGLTHSEEQVLAILCQGCTAPEIARKLHVAVSTVRSHVRSLCAKTQCNSVRALVRQIAVLPPLGACRLHDALH